MAKIVHLTTAIPYVNAKPHLGHVLEWFQTDTLARYYRMMGTDVSFTSGSDENSLKNVQAAEKAGLETQAWLDQYADIFKEAYAQFGISLTGFRRGSDATFHWPGVQKLWELCKHDMYKKSYEGLYCVGCESFYAADELVDGKCPEHLKEPEVVKEENYFFKLSKYQDQIKQLIEQDELRIVSDQFKNEMLGFINQGLEDFSVSRSVERSRGIGVPVPGDDTQVMYVWFDALAIYMTAIGWGYQERQWRHYWQNADQRIHTIGKGINRFHSVYWIGMLLSAGLPTPTDISVHGYITADGQKMSKSLGNVIDPFELVTKYDVEAIRYYLLKAIPTHSDGDFSYTKFHELYTADLANGIGNACSRVAKLCEKSGLDTSQFNYDDLDNLNSELPASSEKVASRLDPEYKQLMESFELDKAAQFVTQLVSDLDAYLSETKPWTLSGPEQHAVLSEATKRIVKIALHLIPFMPITGTRILSHFTQPQIVALQPLFPRLEIET